LAEGIVGTGRVFVEFAVSVVVIPVAKLRPDGQEADAGLYPGNTAHVSQSLSGIPGVGAAGAGHGYVVIDQAVAVVVPTVADLIGEGADEVDADHLAVPARPDPPGADPGVTHAGTLVADLTEPEVGVVVDLGIAVVVESVATDLGRPRMDRGVAVIAVPVVGGDPIAVGVGGG